MEMPIDNVRRPLQLRVPFIQQQTGLGDAVAQLTRAIGVKPCEPCKQRQARLNRALQLNPWRT
jgi:hypothetical protein